jgi:hypothetical protein
MQNGEREIKAISVRKREIAPGLKFRNPALGCGSFDL